MVDPRDVERILTDAARLVGEGEIVLFGSAALSLWLRDPPKTRDVDLWCDPPERGDAVVALMGERSWYHDKHGSYVEVWGPETFAAPVDWRDRAKALHLDEQPRFRLLVPHPHDILLSKLERTDPQDVDHWRRILREYPLDATRLELLLRQTPHRRGEVGEADRMARFEHGLGRLRALLAEAPGSSSKTP